MKITTRQVAKLLLGNCQPDRNFVTCQVILGRQALDGKFHRALTTEKRNVIQKPILFLRIHEDCKDQK